MLNNKKLQKLAHVRREYIKGKLRRQNLYSEPIKLFKCWLKQAFKAKITDPTAMVIATVDKYGQPYQRIVLLKHYDKNGLFFYTNLNSRKARHLKHNPSVSLLFPWYMLERQVMIIGKAEQLTTLEAMQYFHSRPHESQISAWVSKQSSPISTRDILEKKFFKLKKKFQDSEVPLPNFWGGFRISVEQMEFWQGRKHRLHDRFLYRRIRDGWKIERLSP